MLKTLSVHCFARKASTKSQIEAQSIFLENFCRTKGADGIALKILGGEGVEKCSYDFIPCQHVSISVEKNAHWIPGLIQGLNIVFVKDSSSKLAHLTTNIHKSFWMIHDK